MKKIIGLNFNYSNNKELVLSGKKILTSRNYNQTRLLKGEIGYFYLDNVKILVKYYGELKYNQVKKVTLVDYLKGEAFDLTLSGKPTEEKTLKFIKGIGKKHIYKLKIEKKL